MRLIDLDEIEYFTLVDKDGIPRYKIEIGDGLPVVKAIPIEWIERKLAEHWYVDYDIRELLDDWEKENEKDI